MTLNDDGVYLLPDGREMIARQTDGDRFQLFDPLRGPASAPVYFVDAGGRITFWGRPVEWKASDLKDTGRRAVRILRQLNLSRIEFA